MHEQFSRFGNRIGNRSDFVTRSRGIVRFSLVNFKYTDSSKSRARFWTDSSGSRKITRHRERGNIYNDTRRTCTEERLLIYATCPTDRLDFFAKVRVSLNPIGKVSLEGEFAFYGGSSMFSRKGNVPTLLRASSMPLDSLPLTAITVLLFHVVHEDARAVQRIVALTSTDDKRTVLAASNVLARC